MGCGCGGTNKPVPVDADAPDPNLIDDNEAWWQANPGRPPTVAVPMPQ